MNINSSLLTKMTLSLSLGATLGMISGFHQSSLAQSADSLQQQDIYQSNELDSNSSSFGNNVDPWSLIHNINLSNGRSMTEFNQDSAQNIDTAAAEYKRKLQQLWQNQQSPNSNPNAVNNSPNPNQ